MRLKGEAGRGYRGFIVRGTVRSGWENLSRWILWLRSRLSGGCRARSYQRPLGLILFVEVEVGSWILTFILLSLEFDDIKC